MKIFVSATSADLGSFRKTTAEQLQRLGVEAVEQTYFGIDFQALPTLLKEKIKSCDAVICLVGTVFGAAPENSHRSYTQMEYYLGVEFGKRVFIFFSSNGCVLDGSGTDTPEQSEWQREFAASIRSSTQIYYEFNNLTQIRLATAEVVHKLSPEVGGGKSAYEIRSFFPTPLSLLYDDGINGESERQLRMLVSGVIRFIAVLAVHDSATHRTLALYCADTKEKTKLLANPARTTDWLSLLHLSSGEQQPEKWFITELAGWAERNSKVLLELIRAESRLGEVFDDEKQVFSDIRAHIGLLLSDLDFLKRYVLLAVQGIHAATGKWSGVIFRGLASRSFEFTPEAPSSVPPLADTVYILSLARRQALSMSPSLWHRDSAIFSWGGMDSVQDHFELKYLPFEQRTRMTVRKSQADIQSLIGPWLGPDLSRQVFNLATEHASLSETRLMANESWENLQKIIMPDGGGPSVLDGRFCLEDMPIHRGLHADIFGVTDLSGSKTNPDPPSVAHVLRKEGAADETVKKWFERRIKYWDQIVHPQVLKVNTASDARGKDGHPFLLTNRIKDVQSLEQALIPGTKIEEQIALEALKLAAEVSTQAHQKGIFLLSFPIRHFLLDAKGRLFMTGFESAFNPDASTETTASSVQKHLQRFSKDTEGMAPEIFRNFAAFAVTMDVFAIGKLLEKILHIKADLTSLAAWNDPWKCIAYHCLADDPDMRFQSSEQVLMYLTEWLPKAELQTVSIKTCENSFSMGRYLVTNREYNAFCIETNYPRPPHLREGFFLNNEHDHWNLHRLRGPLLPVTYVSCLDAEAYCHWLSAKTGRKWRLPIEAEWMQAAGGPENGIYPWGNDEPDKRHGNFDRFFQGPTVVGAFLAGRSQSGCWDMGGNVWEWCSDMVTDGAPRRVIKGGAYDHSGDAMTIVSREAKVVACRSPYIGFRVLCEDMA
jgi:hypothetical protein